MLLPIDCFGEYLMPGTIICLAEDGIQKVGVVSQCHGNSGSVKVTMYRVLESCLGTRERIVKSQRVFRHDQLQNSVVTVPMTGLNDAVTVYKQIKDHASRLRQQETTVKRVKA